MAPVRTLFLLPFVALVGCAAEEPDNAPLATDYLPARIREQEPAHGPLSCEEIEGSKGWSIIVEEESKGRYAYARLTWSEVDGICAARCGAGYRLATNAQIAKVRDAEATSMTVDGITFDAQKRASSGTSRFWTSDASFTDPYKFDRAKTAVSPEPEPGSEPAYSVMCTSQK